MRKKMKRALLAKRALSILLAISMLVTMVPTSVVEAAGYDDAQVDEINLEPVDDETAALLDQGVVPEQSAPAEDSITLEPVDPETAALLDQGITPDQADAPTGQAEEVVAQAGDDLAVYDEAANVIEVVLDEQTLLNEISKDVYNYDDKVFEIIYQRYEPAYGREVMYAAEQAASVKVNGTEEFELKKQLTYTWEVKGETDYAPMEAGKEPGDVGDYRLAVTYTSGETKYTEYVNIKIVPAELNIGHVSNEVFTAGIWDTFAPGTTVEAATNKNKNEIGFYLNKNTADRIPAGKQPEYISSYDIKVTQADGTELQPTDVLKKNGDYKITVLVTLVEEIKNNYKLGQTTFPIKVDDLIPTGIDATYIGPVGKVYDGKAFTLEDVKKQVTAAVKYDTDDDGTPDTVLADAEIQYAWYEKNITDSTYKKIEDKDFSPVDAGTYYLGLVYEDGKTLYQSVPANPTAKNPAVMIPVTITAADIVVVPEVNASALKDGKIYDHMDIDEFLRTLDYKVYETVTGEDGKVSLATSEFTIDRNYFWGTYYSKSDANKTSQSYEPVFIVERRKKVAEGEKAEAWKKVTRFYKNESDLINEFRDKEGRWPDDEELAALKVAEKTAEYEYRLRFDGEKAVYDIDGDTGNTAVDVNNSESNYHVRVVYDTDTDLADGVLAKVNIALTVEKSTPVTISVEDIVKGLDATVFKGTGADIANPVIKTWDGKGIYANKGEFKKAAVKDSTGASVATGVDEALTYTWQCIDYSKLQENPAGTKEEYDFDYDTWVTLSSVGQAGNTSNQENVQVVQSGPSDTGIYRLRVSYKDKYGKYYVEGRELDGKTDETNSYLYYAIMPQDAIISVEWASETAAPTVYADGINTVQAIKDKITEENLKVELRKAAQNAETGAWAPVEGDAGLITVFDETLDAATNKATLEWWAGYQIRRNIEIQKPIKDAAGTVYWVTCENDELLSDAIEYRVYIPASPLADYYGFDASGDSTKDDVFFYTWAGDKKTTLNPNAFRHINIGKDVKPLPNNSMDGEDGNWLALGEKDKYENVSKALITPKKASGEELYIELDESELKGITKIYDGETFDADAVKAILDLVKIKKKSDNSVVEGVELKHKFSGNVNYWNDAKNNADGTVGGYDTKWVDDLEPTDAGTYSLTIYVETDEKYIGETRKLDLDFVINKRELFLTPELIPADQIRSGMYVGSMYDKKVDNVIIKDRTDYAGRLVLKYALKDAESKEPFTAERYSVTWQAFESETDGLYTGYLKTTGKYYVQATGFKWETLKEDEHKCDDDGSFYRTNYEVICNKVHVPSVARVSARVEGANTKIKDTVTSSEGIFSHVITTEESIPYCRKSDSTIPGKLFEDKDGNYLTFKIYAPDDYWNSARKYFSNADPTLNADPKFAFVYKNSIENTGVCEVLGYVEGVNDGSNVKWDDNGQYRLPYITVVVNATGVLESGKAAEFEIIWGEGYKETYKIDLAKSKLEADLTKAVSPKSLKINGASKKMVVGEGQQLDVKVTKNQLSDVILLGYKSADPETLLVTDDGYVTALKESKKGVKVTVYPCTIVNGEKVAITGTGKNKPKTATITIKVSKIAAPKITSVKATEDGITLKYKKPANGYRRELYILEGNKKANDFENILATAKSSTVGEQFIYARYLTPMTDENGNNLEKGVVTLKDIRTDELDPKKTYTIYVRNVAGLRQFEDGSEVATSVAGSVKKFTTTSAQEIALNVMFTKNAVWEGKYSTNGIDWYTAKLADKKANVQTEAAFYEEYKPDVDYSDDGDFIVRTLPLDAADKKIYKAPTIKYYVSDNIYAYNKNLNVVSKYDDPTLTGPTDVNNVSVKSLVSGYRTDIDAATDANDFYNRYTLSAKRPTGTAAGVRYTEYYWDKKSKIASVTSKGVVTYKGEGGFYLIAKNTATGDCNIAYVLVDAKPDKMTAKKKNITIKAGQWTYLSPANFTYKQGKQSVSKCTGTIVIGTPSKANSKVTEWHEDNFDNGSFRIYRNETLAMEKGYQGGGYFIYALKPNAKLQIKVVDKSIERLPENHTAKTTATINLKSSKIVAVGGLKVTPVYDKKFTVSFTYPESGNDCSFKFEITDNKKNLIKEELLTFEELLNETQLASPIYQETGGRVTSEFYNAKKKTYTLKHEISGDAIRELSKYTVKVTAIHGDSEEPGKTSLTQSSMDGIVGSSYTAAAAKQKKVTTKKIPASYYDVAAHDKVIAAAYNVKTKVDYGTTIYVTDTAATYDLRDYPVLRSNNTYTLSVPLNTYMDNPKAQTLKTDTLKWKSSNSKVASVKADPGTYTAKLKAVKQGTTMITVTSKVTKKIIARYTVHVGALGDASKYFGTYANTNTIAGTVNPKDIMAIELGTPITVSLNNGEAQWFEFTAPAYGKYNFTGCRAYTAPDNTGNLLKTSNQVLKRGEKAYLYVAYVYDYNGIDRNTGKLNPSNSTVLVSGTVYDEITETGKINVKAGQKLYFVAPETNYYSFAWIYTDEDGKEHKKTNFVAARKMKQDDSYVITESCPSSITDDDIVNTTGLVSYTLEIKKRDMDSAGLVAITAKAFAALSADEQKTYVKAVALSKDAPEKWFMLTADETNLYTFYITDVKGNPIKYALYKNATLDVTEAGLTTVKEYRDEDGETSINLKKGETVLVQLKKDNVDPILEQDGSTANLRVTKREILGALTADAAEATAVSVAFGAEAWYSFTAPESNYYTFETKEASTVLDGKYYLAATTAAPKDFKRSNDYDVVLREWLDKDEVAYIRLKSATASAATAKLSVTKQKVETVMNLTTLAGDGYTLAAATAESGVAYLFTAAVSNYYTFSVTEGATVIFDYDVTSSEARTAVAGGSGTKQENTLAIWMNAGETIALTIKEVVGTDVKLKASVPEAPEAVALGGDGKAVDVAAGAFKVYTFTAPESADYRFYATGVTKGTLKMNAYGSGEDAYKAMLPENRVAGKYSADEEGSDFYLYVKKGHKAYITVEGPAAGTIKAEAIAVTELKVGETGAAVSLGEKAVLWYSFTAPETNCYTFSYTEAAENISVARYDEDTDTHSIDWATYNSITNNKKLDKYAIALAKGQKIYLRLTSRNATSAAPVTTTLTIAKRTVQPGYLTVGQVVKAEKDEKWYAFKAYEGNYYDFRFTTEFGDNRGVNVTRYNDLSSTTGYGLSNVWVSANNTIYFCVKASADERPLDATFSYSKRNLSKALTMGVDEKVELVDAKNPTWYMFEVPEKNTYTFTFEGVTDKMKAGLYTGTTGGAFGGGSYDADEGEDFKIEYGFNPQNNPVVYVKLESDKASAEQPVNATLKVTKIELNQPEADIAAEANKTITLDVKEEKWFTFNPTVSGYYSFYFTETEGNAFAIQKCTSLANAGTSVAVKPSSADTRYQTVASIANAWYSKLDDPIYLKISAATGAKVNVKVVYRAKTGDLAVGETGVDMKALGKNDENWYLFTAAEDGVYTITSKDANESLTATVYDKNAMNNLADDRTDNGETFSYIPDDLVTSVNSNDVTCTLVLKKGESRYVKITAADARDDNLVNAKLFVTKRVSAGPLTDAMEITLKPNEEAWYEFTAAENMDYTFSFIVEEGAIKNIDKYNDITKKAAADNTNYITYSAANKSAVETKSLKKGDKFYLKLVANDPEKGASVRVRITTPKVENIADLTTATSVTVGEKEKKWYRFVATEDNVYTFSFTEASMGVKAEVVSAYITDATDAATADTFYDEKTAKEVTGGKKELEKSLAKGDVRYIRVSSDEAKGTEQATAKLSVEKLVDTATLEDLSAYDLNANASAKTITLDPKESKWFTYTITESNKYSFNIKAEDGGVTVNYMASLENANGGTTLSTTSEINAPTGLTNVEIGKPFYIRLTGNTTQGAEVSVRISKRTLTEDISAMKNGESKEFKIDADKEAWYYFKAPVSAEYTFLLENVNRDIDVEVTAKNPTDGILTNPAPANLNDATGAKTITAAAEEGFFKKSLDRGDSFYIRVKPNGTAGERTYKMSVSWPVSAGALAADGEVSFADENKFWYTYTAPETNYYNFYFTADRDGGNVDYFMNLTEMSDDTATTATKFTSGKLVDTSGKLLDVKLFANQKVYILVNKKTSGTATKTTMKVTKRDLTGALELIKQEEVATKSLAVDLGVNEAKWYSFKAPEDNYYTISFEKNSGNNISIDEFSAMDQDTTVDPAVAISAAGGGSTTAEYSLSKGDELFFRMSSSADSDTETVKVAVTAREVKAALPLADGEKITLKRGDELWYSYTAAEKNIYDFYFEAASKSAGLTVAYLTNSIKGDTPTVPAHPTLSLDAKDTVYFRLTAPTLATTTEVSYKIVSRVKTADLAVDADAVEIKLAKNDVKWYRFEAKEDNYYTFTVTIPNVKQASEEDMTTVAHSVNLTMYNSLDANVAASTVYTDKGNLVPFGTKDEDIATEYKEIEMTPGLGMRNGDIVWLKIGSATKSTEEVKVADIKVTKRAVAAEALKAGTLTVPAKKEVWYSYTPTETNWYTFRFTPERDEKGNSKSSGLDVSTYADLMDGGTKDTYVNGNEIRLVKQTKYYFRLYMTPNAYTNDKNETAYYTEANFNVTIAKRGENAAELALGTEASATLKVNEAKWYHIAAATEENVYTFKLSAVNEKNDDGTNKTNYRATAVVYTKDKLTDASSTAARKTSITTVNGEGTTTCNVAKGDELYVKLTSPDAIAAVGTTPARDITAKLTVSKRELAGALADKQSITLKDKEDAWYTFTADEDTWYSLYLTSDLMGNISIYKYTTLTGSGVRCDRDTDTVGSSGVKRLEYETKMIKGQKYYVMLRYTKPTGDGAKDSATVNVKVVKRTAAELAVSKVTDAAKEEVLEFNDAKWYHFKALEDNYYNFYFITEKDDAKLPKATLRIAETDKDAYDKYVPVYDGNDNVTYTYGKDINGNDGSKQDLGDYGTFPNRTKFRDIVANADGDYVISDYYMAKGAEIYFRMTSPDAKAAVGDTAAVNVKAGLKVTKRELTGELPIATEITLKNGIEQWFSFKAPKDTYYSLLINAETGKNITVERFAKLSDATGMEIDLSATTPKVTMTYGPQKETSGNESYLIRMTYTTTDTAEENQTNKVTVKLIKREVEKDLSLAAATEVTLKKDGEHWYRFTATEDNYYTFASTGADGAVTAKYCNKYNYKNVASPISFTTMLNATNGKDIKETGIGMAKDEEIYIRLTSADATAEKDVKANLTVTKRDAKPLPIETDITLEADKEQWFLYTAPSTNLYTFRLEATAGTVETKEGYSALKNTGPNSDYNALLGGTEKKLDRNTKVYIKLKSTAGATVKVAVQKREKKANLPISETGIDVALGANAVEWYYFEADEANYYTFKATAQEGSAGTLSTAVYDKIDSTSVSTTVTLSYGTEISLAKGKSFYLRLSTSATGTEVTKVKLTATKRVAEALPIGTEFTVKADTDQWYVYTAPATNIYAINFIGTATVQGYASLTAAYSATSKQHEFMTGTETPLTKGEKVYVMLHSGSEVKVTAKLQERKVADTLTTGETGVSIALKQSEAAWYYFEAKEANKYTFKKTDLEGGAAGTLVTAIYDSLESTTTSSKPFGYDTEISYTKGTKFYIKATTNATGTEETKVKLTVTKREATPLPIGTEITVKTEPQWFSYTAPATNYYIINFMGGAVNAEGYASLSADGTFTSINSVVNGTEAQLTKNMTYYVKLWAAAEVKVTAKLQKREVKGELSLGGDGTGISLGDKDVAWYYFEAPEDNYYTITVTAGTDSKGTLTVSPYQTWSDIENASDWSFDNTTTTTYSKYLNEGKQFYIRLSNSGVTGDEKTTATLKVTKRVVKGIVSLTTSPKLTLKKDEESWYKFTAPYNGQYKFTITEASDAVQAELYNSMNATYGTPFAADLTTTTDDMTSDTVRYIKVSSSAATAEKAVTATLSVTRENGMTVANWNMPLNDVTTVELEAASAGTNPYKYYRFECTESGNYYYEFTTDLDVAFELYRSGDGTYDNYGSVTTGGWKWFDSGFSYYLKATNSGSAEKEIDVTLRKVEELTASVSGERYTYTGYPVDETWFTVMPQVSGTYVFDHSGATIEWYGTNRNDTASAMPTTQYLNSGYAYYIKVKNTNSMVSITIQEYTTHTSGGAASLDPNETVMYSLDLKALAVGESYNLEVKFDKNTYCQISLYDSMYNRVTDWGYYNGYGRSFVIDSGMISTAGTYYVRVTSNSNEATNFTVDCGKALSVGSTITVTLGSYGTGEVYSFDASPTANYEVEFDNITDAVQANLYYYDGTTQKYVDALSMDSVSGTQTKTYQLYGGRYYYLKLISQSTSVNVDVEVSTGKWIDQLDGSDCSDLSANNSKWYYYMPDEDGSYGIISSSDEDITVKWYDDAMMRSGYYETINGSATKDLKAGTPYYLEVENTDSTSGADYEIMIVSAEPFTGGGFIGGDTKKCYSYTPAQSGTYNILTEVYSDDEEDDYSLSYRLYGPGVDGSRWSSYAHGVNLTAGATYYLLVYNNYNDIDLEYSVQIVPMVNYTSGVAEGQIDAGSEVWYSFTPNNYDWYYLLVEQEGSLDALECELYCEDYGDTWRSAKFNAGELKEDYLNTYNKYYLRLKNTNESSVNYSVQIATAKYLSYDDARNGEADSLTTKGAKWYQYSNVWGYTRTFSVFVDTYSNDVIYKLYSYDNRNSKYNYIATASGNTVKEVQISANSQIYLCVENTSDVSGAPYTLVILPGKMVEVENEGNGYYSYRFTPDQSKYYNFSARGGLGSEYISVYTGDGDLLREGNTVGVSLSAGTTYIIQASTEDNVNDGDNEDFHYYLYIE